MRKFTFLFLSLFFGALAAFSQEATDFNSPSVTPSADKAEMCVYNIRLSFSKNITVTMPDGGIDVINTVTNEIVKIANVQVYDWEPNVAVFEFEQKVVSGKDGEEELQPQYIETPGTYTYTIPAGCITSVDGDEFAEHTYTFTVVSTFNVVDYSPKATDKLEKVVLTFAEEIVSVNIPEQGLAIYDMYYSNAWYTKNEAAISDDKKSVTLELVEPITEVGIYDLAVSPGVFVSADGINNYITATITIQDMSPSFYTNYDDENRVQEIPGLAIGFKNVNEVQLVDDAEPVVVYMPGGSDAYGTAEIINGSIIVTFDTELTEEGLYTFVIPEGMFTMDGVANESREVGVELYTFTITPLEIVGVTPAAGTVNQIDRIVVEYNQNVSLAYDEYWQMISGEILMSDGVKDYTLTYNSMSSVGNTIEYLVNAVWTGYEYAATPITAAGTYTINVGDIVVNYAPEKYIDEWGWENTMYHGKGSCEGTYSWIIDPEVSDALLGDVNEDGRVGVADITTVVDAILNESSDSAYDLNGDGRVGVTDITTIIDIILNEGASAASNAPARVATRSTSALSLYIDPFEINAGEEKEILVNLSNPGTEITAVEFDLFLPAGLEVVSDEYGYYVLPGSRTPNKRVPHSVSSDLLSSGAIHVICYHNSQLAFTGEDGDVLAITIKAAEDLEPGNYTIDLKNIELVNPADPKNGILISDNNTVVTDIEQIEAEEEGTAEIYDLSGRRVNSLVKGIYIVNGKKVVK